MFKKLALILFVLVVVRLTASAQVNTAAISGVVADASGAIVPDSQISIKNVDNGLTRSISTDAQGRYQAVSLPSGNYEVEVSKEGFQSQVRRGIALSVGRDAVVDFQLQLGAVSQKVEITGEAPLVETTQAALSNLVEATQIQELPLNGRSFTDLASLQPGIVQGRIHNSANYLQSGYTPLMSIRGARSEQNLFLLDGTNVMGPTNSIPGSVGGQSLGVDTVREFRVETSSFNAQFGRAAGGVMNIITRSGTDTFHGTLFEFLRNSALDARNFFDVNPSQPTVRSSPPPFRRNQFGFSAGGPIKKDKTFYFGSFEGLRERLGMSLTTTVPDAGARQGIVPNPTTGVITRVIVNPVVIPYLNLYPSPNGRNFNDGTGELITPYSQPTNENFWSTRIDQNFSSNDTFFGRYTFDNGAQKPAQGFNFILNASGNRNQYLTLSETHIFSPRLLSTFRFGFNRSRAALTPEVTGISKSALTDMAFVPGVPFLLISSGIIPGGGLSNLEANRNAPRIFVWNSFEYSDDLTFSTGMHTFQGGFLFNRMQFNQNEFLTGGGEFTFGGLTSLLLGQPASVQVQALGKGLAAGYRYNYYGWYFQDDIRVNPRFTLNLGLRHEFYTSPSDVRGRNCNLDFLIPGTFRCGGNLFPPYFSDWKDFGPRVGLAWDVFGNGKTSLRGGFGIYYDSLSPIWWIAQGGTQPPMSNQLTLASTPANPLPFPNIAPAIAGLTGTYSTPSPVGFTTVPSTLQYTLTLQRQLSSDLVLSLGYAGAGGRHMWSRANQNTSVPVILSNGVKYFPAGLPLPNPNFGGRVNYNLTNVSSGYNGFLMGLQRRMSHGLQFQLSYTYSKALDENPNISTNVTTYTNNAAEGLLDPSNWRLDHSLSDFDVRHNVSFNYEWQVPFGSGKTGIAGKLVHGWEVTGIVRAGSGSPLSVTATAKNWSNNGAIRSDQRPNLLPGRSNNPVLGSPDKWFDPTAFQVPTIGYYGTLGRNTVTGPDLVTVDMSLLKTFVLSQAHESAKLQFRAECFNFLNHANFGVPVIDIFTSSGAVVGNAGRIGGTSTASRQVQFGLKLFW